MHYANRFFLKHAKHTNTYNNVDAKAINTMFNCFIAIKDSNDNAFIPTD